MMKNIFSYIYSYLSFDNFCRLKEYPHDVSKKLCIPSWKYYFEINNIKIIKLFKKNMENSLKSARIFFKNGGYVSSKIYAKYGMDKFEIAANIDSDFIDIQVENTLCINYLKKCGLIRNPYYLTLDDIINNGYFKLLGYIIYTYFDKVDVSYLLYSVKLPDGEIISLEKRMCAIRVSMHVDKGYIIKNIKKYKRIIDGLENSILKKDFSAVIFLIEELGMKPTIGNMKLIKKYIPQLETPLDLIF